MQLTNEQLEKWKKLISETNNKIVYDKMEEFEIVTYEKTLNEWIKELNETNPNEVISWGYKEMDDKMWYILPWQLILVWGTTWTWKSTFTSDIAKNISKLWKTVLKFTLEDRLEDRKKQDLYYKINHLRKKQWLNWYPYNDFFSNNINNQIIQEEIKKAREILIKENNWIFEVVRNKETQMWIEDIEWVIKKWIEKWVKLIVLDHLQEFKVDWTQDRQDLKIEQMMYKIKNLSRKYNIAIILIAHFRKVEWMPTMNSFKDSVAITQVPNKVILLYRDLLEENWITEMIIAKNREKPNWTWILELCFDINELKYTNVKTEALQKVDFI